MSKVTVGAIVAAILLAGAAYLGYYLLVERDDVPAPAPEGVPASISEPAPEAAAAPEAPEPAAEPAPAATAEAETAEEPEAAAEGPVEIRVTGTVVDASSGAPLPDVRVVAEEGRSGVVARFMGFGDGEEETPKEVASATTDANGAYSLTLSADEEVFLTGDATGYALSRRALPEAPDGEAQVDFKLSPATAVSGRVTDAKTGAGIAGIEVAAVGQAENFRKTMEALHAGRIQVLTSTTDADGAFRCERLEPGTYKIVPDAADKGYTAPKDDVTVAVEAAKDVTGINIALDAGASLVVRVLDPQGQPVSDANVILVPGQFLQAAMNSLQSQRPGDFMRHQTTGDDGECRFGGLEYDKEYRVRAAADDFAITTGPAFRLASEQGEQRQEIRLTAGSTVSGRVQLTSGSPAQDVKVTLMPNVAEIIGGSMIEPRSEQTDGTGQYSIDHLPAGEYTLMAGDVNPAKMFLGGAASDSRVTVRVDGVTPATGVDLVLSDETAAAAKGGSISGVVLGPDGKPVSGARVKADQGGMNIEVFRAETTAEGTFEFAQLRGKAYNLTAEADAGYSEQKGVVPGETVTLRLGAPTRISGRVLDPQGGPAPNCAVSLTDPTGGANPFAAFMGGASDVASTQTDADGRFAFDNVRPGVYTAKASSPELGHGQKEGIAVKAGTQVKDLMIRLKEGVRFAGSVRNGSGEPLAGATVSLAPVQAGQPEVMALMAGMAQGGLSATAAEDGSFEIAKLAAGTYVVTATHSGYAKSAPEQVALGDSDVTGYEIVLPKGGSARGQFMQDGVPVANAMIQLVGPNGMYMVSADAEGRFSLDGITPGEYMLQATDPNALHQGGLPQAVQARPQVVTVGEGEDVPIDFAPRGDVTFTGTVSGENLGNFVTVSVRRPGGPAPEDLNPGDIRGAMEAAEYFEGQALMREDGTFEIEGLRPGDYILEVYSISFDPENPDIQALMQMDRSPALRQDFTVGSDNRIEMDIVLPPRNP